MTFSIVARCANTGALGVAVSTAVPAVGTMCPYVRPGVGAVSTQSWVNPYLAMQVLDLLEAGESVADALAHVLQSDQNADLRQLGIVAADGSAASWTGTRCTGWRGDRTATDYAIQGNMLVGAATLDAMQKAYVDGVGLRFEERLLRALEAGQAAGGDKRGRQSASLLVYRDEAYPYLDLRVDEHPDPVIELRRIFEVALVQLLPFIESMPNKIDPAGIPPQEVEKMLMLSPAQRPGGKAVAGAPGNTALLQEIAGLDFSDERMMSNLAVFRPILAEIRKLRTIDFSDVHPAVIFDPTAAWRRNDL
jgi:uncharacterized Ntn-hydrolase superfamily protein